MRSQKVQGRIGPNRTVLDGGLKSSFCFGWLLNLLYLLLGKRPSDIALRQGLFLKESSWKPFSGFEDFGKILSTMRTS